MGLLCSNNCFPKAVSGGTAGGMPCCVVPAGTAAPDIGPAQVPDKSRFGAGPPFPMARSIGRYFHGDCAAPAFLSCELPVWAAPLEARTHTAVKLSVAPINAFRISRVLRFKPYAAGEIFRLREYYNRAHSITAID